MMNITLKNKDLIIECLKGQHDAELFRTARQITDKIFSQEIYIRGIIEFSNYCKQTCNYCGLRAANKKVPRYRLSQNEILQCAEQSQAYGIPTIVLQSGEDPAISDGWITETIQELKAQYNVAITLSLGERSYRTYEQWKQAGADRYLLRMEHFCPSVYETARPGHSVEERFEKTEFLRKLGYEVGSGFMVGLPGETIETLADNIIELSKMNLHMIGIGPFVPHYQTPFKNEKTGDINLTFRTLALIRILNPMANMPTTSALNSVQNGARLQGLKLGMNVIMPSLTPPRVKRLYNIYPGKNLSDSSFDSDIKAIKEMILAAGMQWSSQRGDSPLFTNQTINSGVCNV